jgi:hypothetical protein
MSRKLKPTPLGERPGREPYNASEVLALSDSTFLFCDNNVSDALFEFRLRRDGTLRGRIARRRIAAVIAVVVQAAAVVTDAGNS